MNKHQENVVHALREFMAARSAPNPALAEERAEKKLLTALDSWETDILQRAGVSKKSPRLPPYRDTVNLVIGPGRLNPKAQAELEAEERRNKELFLRNNT